MTNINFKSVVIIGLGLIGSSIARAIKEKEISKKIYGIDTNEENIKKCLNLKIISKGEKSLKDLNQQTDLIIICSPLSTYKEIFFQLGECLDQNTLVT
ncbi:prephenate dehydrogenase/arogenate dehydrogenase family protein, partial [Alphaproteobacteria bacterium]|nr:prephenate dehydrogenase/arogenate dehydrogenase family protein [Alphaproteobacteria bacterium]